MPAPPLGSEPAMVRATGSTPSLYPNGDWGRCKGADREAHGHRTGGQEAAGKPRIHLEDAGEAGSAAGVDEIGGDTGDGQRDGEGRMRVRRSRREAGEITAVGEPFAGPEKGGDGAAR